MIYDNNQNKDLKSKANKFITIYFLYSISLPIYIYHVAI